MIHFHPRRLFPVLLALASIAASAPAQDARQVERYDAATFFATTSYSGAAFAADGKHILFSSDASGVFNVWSIPVGGGEAAMLTDSETDACFVAASFPEDGRFLYTADQGGNELNHVYVRSPGGSLIDLTPGEGLRASFAGWLLDDSAFHVRTNERDPKHFDLYRYSVPGPDGPEYPRELLFENTDGFGAASVSPDGRWLAMSKTRNNADSDVYVVDLAAEKIEPVLITEHEGDISHKVATFTADSKKLYYLSNEGSEFEHVLSHDLESGEHTVVYEADWDVSYLFFSRDGRYQVSGVNADARTQVTIRDLEKGRDVSIRDLPRGDLRGVRFARGGGQMAFYVNGDTSPSNLFTLDLETGKHRQLTDSLSAKIDPANLVESRVIRYPSFDQLEIPALLYHPHPASAVEPVPALVWVHGGPGGQSRTGYNPTIQHLVNQGYAILAVNNRGSSGYGKTFHHLDDRKHGDVDLKDCVWARRYLEGLEWVDGERVGIIGGSYGGYMVVAALAFEPDAFDMGIDIFGVTNWLRTLESIPPWWESFRDSLYAEMGDPAQERKRLEGNSPLFHAKNITKPLLVVQGANDPRVLKVESDEIVAAVEANGIPVRYIVFDDEGHGFRKKENRIEASEAYARFAEEHLKKVPVDQ